MSDGWWGDEAEFLGAEEEELRRRVDQRRAVAADYGMTPSQMSPSALKAAEVRRAQAQRQVPMGRVDEKLAEWRRRLGFLTAAEADRYWRSGEAGARLLGARGGSAAGAAPTRTVGVLPGASWSSDNDRRR